MAKFTKLEQIWNDLDEAQNHVIEAADLLKQVPEMGVRDKLGWRTIEDRLRGLIRFLEDTCKAVEKEDLERGGK